MRIRRLVIYCYGIGILAILAGISLLAHSEPSIRLLCIVGGSVVAASSTIAFFVLVRKDWNRKEA